MSASLVRNSREFKEVSKAQVIEISQTKPASRGNMQQFSSNKNST